VWTIPDLQQTSFQPVCRDSDRSPGAKLDASYRATADAWQQLYGTPYERAGTLDLGDPPNPPTSPPAALGIPASDIGPSNTNRELQDCLTDRKVFQVCVAVLGANNLGSHKGRLYVRVKPLVRAS
jgi:hypothetical protein